jgi:hypothetical protein
MHPIRLMFAAMLAVAMIGAATRAGAEPTKKKFYAIAHMVNTTDAVRWAVPQGVNALEVDVQFAKNGEPLYFKHGHSCDCSCPHLLTGGHVCSHLANHCDATTPIPDMLHLMAAESQIALVIFDSKIADTQPEYQLDAPAQRHAAERILKLAEEHLFSKGYRGKLLVSAGTRYAAEYVREVSRLSLASRYHPRIYFSFDMENSTAIVPGPSIHGANAADTMRLLATFPSKNRAYGAGVTACLGRTYYDEMTVGVQNLDRGGVSFVYLWSLNSESSMEKYIDLGVMGIMSNYPATLVQVARRKGLTLARPEDPLPTVTNDHIVGGGCDCDYHPGGCRITHPAPDGQACKCEYKGAWTCAGETVSCDPNNPLCRHPDASIEACALGRGDCDGYQEAKCDCNYHPGGCSISRAAPRDTACKCEYKGAWTCGGSVVQCSDPNSPHCKNPDTTKASCLLGRGDCDAHGYR